MKTRENPQKCRFAFAKRKFFEAVDSQKRPKKFDEELAVAACCGHDFFLSYQAVSRILWRISEQKSRVDAVFRLRKFWFWGVLAV